MWRAALPCRRTHLALLCLTIAATAVVASPVSSAATAPKGQVWAVALPSGVKIVKPAQLRWLATRGVTTVVVFGAPQRSLQPLAAAASRAKLNVIAPKPGSPKVACKASTGALRTCAALAPSVTAAVKLARRGLVDFVVVRVSTPRQLRMLRGSGAKRSRIVAVLPLSSSAAGRAAWRAGVAYAAADPALELAVGSSSSASRALGNFLSDLPRQKTVSAAGPVAGPTAPVSLLVVGRSISSVSLRWTPPSGPISGYGVYKDSSFVLNVGTPSIVLTGLVCGRSYTFSIDAYDASGGRSSPISTVASTDPCPTAASGGGGGGGGGATDVLPPTTPLGLAKSSSTQTSINVTWTSSTDNVGVVGYGLYRGGSTSGSSFVTSFAFSGLTCGTTYSLAVDAYDAVGNRSGKTTISAATSACAGGGDTSAPTVPGALSKTGSTTTSISVSWNASSDNVGVSGYGLYRNSASTGSTSSRSSTFAGLACGTSYTLSVDAYDAAGNRSAKANLTAATTACPPSADTQPPTVPQGMTFGTITQTTVDLSWTSATDNVGVAGYNLLRDGLSVATVATPGYTYTGLTCGTMYTFALEAYDAAGNASDATQASGSTSTAACAGSPPPPPPPPPSTGLANLWVDTNGGTCAYSATPIAYSDAAACGPQFDLGWDKLAAGNTARVRPGVYGQQVITGNKTAPTYIIGEAGVTISGSTPATCGYQDGLVCANANYLNLSDMTIDAGSVHGQSSGSEVNGTNVTFDHVNLHGSFVSLYLRAQNFTWNVGSLGQDGVNGGQRSCNTGDGEPVWIESSAGGATLDGIRFNSMSASGAACPGSVDGMHLEYVRVQETQNVTIRNSVFVPDAGSGNGAGSGKIFVTSSSTSSTAANGLKLIGNNFAPVNGSYSIQTHTNVQNANGWQIKNNTFSQPVTSPNLAAGAACGNIGPVALSWKTAC